MSERHPWAVSGVETAIFKDVDHDAVTVNVIESLFNAESTSVRLVELWSQFESIDRQTVTSINDMGNFTKITDPCLGIDPDVRIPMTFMSGGIVALEVLRELARQTGLDERQIITDLRSRMTVIDINRREDLNEVERFALLGSFILERGRLELQEMDDAYELLIGVVAENYPESAAYASHLTGGFGFVLGAGMRAAASLKSTAMADEIMSMTDFESEMARLLGSD